MHLNTQKSYTETLKSKISISLVCLMPMFLEFVFLNLFALPYEMCLLSNGLDYTNQRGKAGLFLHNQFYNYTNPSFIWASCKADSFHLCLYIHIQNTVITNSRATLQTTMLTVWTNELPGPWVGSPEWGTWSSQKEVSMPGFSQKEKQNVVNGKEVRKMCASFLKYKHPRTP